MHVRKEARARFLKVLAATGNVTLAADAAELPRGSLYHWREHDKNFAAAWAEAIEAATDALEAEARRRALEGVETAIVQGGRLVRDDEGNPLTIRRYSDSLLALLLRAHRPEKYDAEKYRQRSAPESTEPEPRKVSFRIRIGDPPQNDEEKPARPGDEGIEG
ncbi:MAG TPA: hypothetical protein VG848_04000 [Acetobacteraceae bacterium]|jgi:hypothetical protein|nr:hypothetical protein [Acetobacteraceae bacterium]